jgi:carbamoyltransferase
VEYTWDNGEPVVGRLYTRAMEELFGPVRGKQDPLAQRHKDLARSVQAMYEEAFFHLLKTLHARHGLEALALAGGCAMNSVANGKIYRHTPIRRVYIQSAAGDAGGAIGAAIGLWHRLQSGARNGVMDHAYWGPQYSEEMISALLNEKDKAIREQSCRIRKITDEAELCHLTATAIADGKVVGWFQGRMEWGPRALGNRSILGDPRRADMKDILNLKIKRRESFRPFAPSILREAVPEWFETDDDVPFMMEVFQIREEKRVFVPAVTHVDGSGRLQTVHRHTNPRYHRLIETFARMTGVPMVLNTSFNENEPVVCRPEEALDCFLRTRMDVLVMGDSMLVRENARD